MSRRGAYYAGPGNMFWPTLHAVGLTPRRLQPEEYCVILSFGFSLTELVKAVSGVNNRLCHRIRFELTECSLRSRMYVPMQSTRTHLPLEENSGENGHANGASHQHLPNPR